MENVETYFYFSHFQPLRNKSELIDIFDLFLIILHCMISIHLRVCYVISFSLTCACFTVCVSKSHSPGQCARNSPWGVYFRCWRRYLSPIRLHSSVVCFHLSVLPSSLCYATVGLCCSFSLEILQTSKCTARKHTQPTAAVMHFSYYTVSGIWTVELFYTWIWSLFWQRWASCFCAYTDAADVIFTAT